MSATRAGRSEAKAPQSGDRVVGAVEGTLGCRREPGERQEQDKGESPIPRRGWEQTQPAAAGRPMSSVPLTSGPCSARPQLLSKANIRHFPSSAASLRCQISLPFLQAGAGVHMLLLDHWSLPEPPPRSSPGRRDQRKELGRGTVSNLILFPSKFQPPKPFSVLLPAEKQPGLQPADAAGFSWKRGRHDTLTDTHRELFPRQLSPP